MIHRELIVLTATYYAPGELVMDEVIETFEDGSVLWWYPQLAQEATAGTLPAMSLQPRLRAVRGDGAARLFATEAICFAPECAGMNGHGESAYALPGVIEGLCVGESWRDILVDAADALKAICDQVRGASGARAVRAMVVCDCDEGVDPSTWASEGEYWSRIEVVGLLDLRQATITTWQRAAQQEGKG